MDNQAKVVSLHAKMNPKTDEKCSGCQTNSVIEISSALTPPPDTLALSQALSDFHLFPRLPLELRTAIWVMALEQPREVRIKTQIPRPGDAKALLSNPWKVETPVVLLAVNAESRKIAKQHSTDRRLEINFKRDVLHFEAPEGYQIVFRFDATYPRLREPMIYAPTLLANLQHVAMCVSVFLGRQFVEDFKKGLFKELKTITVTWLGIGW